MTAIFLSSRLYRESEGRCPFSCTTCRSYSME
nr:MAG TPA_asm: 4Fe-4S single cluster domain protein [Caudoviricetes sp.]